jgi:hypothetical protein
MVISTIIKDFPTSFNYIISHCLTGMLRNVEIPIGLTEGKYFQTNRIFNK